MLTTRTEGGMEQQGAEAWKRPWCHARISKCHSNVELSLLTSGRRLCSCARAGLQKPLILTASRGGKVHLDTFSNIKAPGERSRQSLLAKTHLPPSFRHLWMSLTHALRCFFLCCSCGLSCERHVGGLPVPDIAPVPSLLERSDSRPFLTSQELQK